MNSLAAVPVTRGTARRLGLHHDDPIVGESSIVVTARYLLAAPVATWPGEYHCGDPECATCTRVLRSLEPGQ